MNRLNFEYQQIGRHDLMGPTFGLFPLWDVTGTWASREGGPGLRIFRDKGYRFGGYCVEITYRDGITVHRPIKRCCRDVRYFDLYGFIGLSYDAERDILHLTAFGRYYRK